jgi:hypothetical protein
MSEYDRNPINHVYCSKRPRIKIVVSDKKHVQVSGIKRSYLSPFSIHIKQTKHILYQLLGLLASDLLHALNLIRCPRSLYLPLLLTLDTAPERNIGIGDKLIDDVAPALVSREGLIELARDLAQFPETCPGHGWKVVVLVVQAYIVGKEVEDAVVGVGFWGGDRRGCGLWGCIVVLKDILQGISSWEYLSKGKNSRVQR